MGLDKKALNKAFWALAFPLILQSLVTAVVNATDALMLGSLNQASLSAITLAGQVMKLFTKYVAALCVGSSALLAQYYGKKDMESVNRIVHVTLQAAMLGGSLFFAASLLMPSLIMRVYTNDPELIAIGSPYLRCISFSFMFMSFSQLYLNLMKNTGAAKLGSAFGMVTVVSNIVFDYLLIFGKFGFPALGAYGAALGTVISYAVELLLTFVAARKNKKLSLRPKMFLHFDRVFTKKFLRYTTPTLVQSMSWAMARSMMVAIIGHQGSDVVSASAVVLIILGFADSIAMGYALASGIVVGHMLGRGEMKKARASGDYLLKKAALLSLVAGAAVSLGGPAIAPFFSNLTPQAHEYLRQMLIFSGFLCFARFVNTTLTKGLFSAGGDIAYPMRLDIINMWLVVLPLGLFAAYELHLPPMVVYIILNLDEYYEIYFMFAHYRKYRWLKNLTKKEWASVEKYRDDVLKKIALELPTGILMVGEFGRIAALNKACGDVLGRDVKEIEGSNYKDFFLSDPNNTVFADAVLEALEDKANQHEFIADYHTENGVKSLSVRSMFVEDESNKLGVCLLIEENVQQ